MLHSLSTQGRFAVHYHFKNQSAYYLKSILQELASGSTLVVSSRFRTDVFYDHPEVINNQILSVWRSMLGEDKARFHLERFKAHSGEEKVFQEFFTELTYLHQVKKWYEEYVREFREVFSLDPANPIMSRLVSCDRYLINQVATPSRHYLIDENEKIEAPRICDLSELAMSAIIRASQN